MNTVMADIFLTEDTKRLLKNKYVLFIGDSVIRAMYKDMVKILQSNDLLSEAQLKNKGELYFENDELLEGGEKGIMSNDTSYTEVREFKSPFHLVKFYFITRCYSDYLKSICEDIRNDSDKPDVVIMNSGCWDLTRYGINSIYEYKQNLPIGIYSLIKVLPSYTVFLWTTTMPLSKDVRGGFMIPEVESTKSKLREDVLEANYYAVNVMNEFKLDVLDLHYYFHKQIQRRARDGIHWDATAHRRISNLILNHLCDAWEIEIPGRIIASRECLYEVDENEQNEIYTDFVGESNRPDGRPNSPLPSELMNRIDDIKRMNMINNGYVMPRNPSFSYISNQNNNNNMQNNILNYNSYFNLMTQNQQQLNMCNQYISNFYQDDEFFVMNPTNNITPFETAVLNTNPTPIINPSVLLPSLMSINTESTLNNNLNSVTVKQKNNDFGDKPLSKKFKKQ